VFDNVLGWGWGANEGSTSRVGWTAGGGVEYAWTNNWVLGAEFLYYDLGSRTLATVPSVAASSFFGANVFSSTKVNFTGEVARARISYKF
jgi:outer membrane immunogenic protein